MNFNVNIEIDWISEDSTLDDELQQRIISNLTTQIEDRCLSNISKQIAETASSLVRAKTELLINTALEQPITITKGWNDKKEYPSVYDMVEEQMTALYKGKLESSGTCQKDPLLNNIEHYVKNEVTRMLNSVTDKIQRHAKASAKDAIRENALLKSISSVIGEVE